ncbi:MAG: F0F1 ATP synthase subunit alpha, partial [Armatimonadetes bacterium]|nr:F0F1 ATP synthase subunit alpha [Armatimonadota bacterium]
MASVRPDEITAILERQITNFSAGVEEVGVGTVLQVGDGVARVYGLRDCAVAELLEFPGGVMGMALNLDEVNVGEGLIGRVVDALGIPLDGG